MVGVSSYVAKNDKNAYDMIKIILKKASGVLLVFDLTEKKTFQILDQLVKDIQAINKRAKIVIVGNKLDLKEMRKVSYDEVKAWVNDYGYTYMEVSAQKNFKVEDVYSLLI